MKTSAEAGQLNTVFIKNILLKTAEIGKQFRAQDHEMEFYGNPRNNSPENRPPINGRENCINLPFITLLCFQNVLCALQLLKIFKCVSKWSLHDKNGNITNKDI